MHRLRPEQNFKAVSLNVDGLPESLLGGAVKMNVGGPLEAGSKAMGEFISNYRTDWDLFALSEDFNFEDELKAGLGDGKYTFGTHRGKMYNKIDVLTSPFDTDGLNIMVRNESGINFSGETYVRFTDSYGKTSDGSDELIKKDSATISSTSATVLQPTSTSTIWMPKPTINPTPPARAT